MRDATVLRFEVEEFRSFIAASAVRMSRKSRQSRSPSAKPSAESSGIGGECFLVEGRFR
jgi:hypothetical protein